MDYPEHDKLTKVKDNSQLLGEFLEWTRSNGYEFCSRVVVDATSPWEKVEYQPYRKPIDDILAEFYEIDLKKLESEKCQMIDAIRTKAKGG